MALVMTVTSVAGVVFRISDGIVHAPTSKLTASQRDGSGVLAASSPSQ